MLELSPVQVHRSFDGLAAGMLATHLLSAGTFYDDSLHDRVSNIRSYQASRNTSTLGTASYVENETLTFLSEEPLVSFFTKLLSTQERLGEEFENVLHDNLWDLYAR
jgi:hypothetical protein